MTHHSHQKGHRSSSSFRGGPPATVTAWARMLRVMLVETAVIRAASLQYTCDSLGSEDDAILSTCDSFRCGGQVEPTAETNTLERICVSYTRIDLRLQPHCTEPRNLSSCSGSSCVCSCLIKTAMGSQKGSRCLRHSSTSSILTLNASKMASATSWQATQFWQAGWAKQQEQASLVYG